MDKININPIRLEMQGFSSIFGKRIVTVRCENIDLTYAERNQKNSYGLPAKPFKKYFCESYDVTSIDTIKLSDGCTIVEINHNPHLQFKIDKPEFADVSTTNIAGAIESQKPIFFSDYKACSEQVQLMNERVQSDITTMMNELMHQIEALKSINSQEKAAYIEYADSLKINS